MKHFRLSRLNLLLVSIALITAWGMFSRYMAYADLGRHAREHGTPTVNVILAKGDMADEDIVLPANVQAWHEAPIFARTNGYMKHWVTDIGASVKAGDLIAEIDTPEVDAQLHQAEADLHTAQANNELAQVTAKRWVALLKTNSVSKQEADEKVSDAKSKEALMASAKANVDRLKELESFKRITAPFDGTITARNVDDGALINSGSTTTARELFHIADVHKLRVYVQVPQSYVISLKRGYEAKVRFTESPGKEYTATLTSTAGAIDPVTRTLLLEFELDNANGELMSGSYAEVHMKLPLATSSIVLPVNVLLFRADGMKVATISDDNHIMLRSVTIHRDFGNQFEVSSGISAGEKVVVNPQDSLENGQEVKVVMAKDSEKDKANK